jgi:hypothetical protein
MKPAAAAAPHVRWFHCLTCGEEFARREDHDYQRCRWAQALLLEIACGEIPELEYRA